MDFVNETGLQAGWCVGFQQDGRELLVITVKATYGLSENGGELKLAEEQIPLTKADRFTGEPGTSATWYESDYAHKKPLCDVLLNGSAHAPRGRPVRKAVVGLRVGPIRKRFEVVGDRTLRRFLLWAVRGGPRRFLACPISYDRAYGGVDRGRKPDQVRTYPDNPIGLGYYPLSRGSRLIGRPLPNTQQIGKTATKRKGKYRPMSFGPMGRNFRVRVPYAGTYDAKWAEERMPFFPADFDYRYFQCAPPDQQMPYPTGGEEVVLENLTPAGVTRFRLPKREVPVLVLPHDGDATQLDPVVDTVLIEPDQGRLMLTWRASLPLQKSVFDVRQVVVGKSVQQHLEETREDSKIHYANLDEMIRAKQRARAE